MNGPLPTAAGPSQGTSYPPNYSPITTGTTSHRRDHPPSPVVPFQHYYSQPQATPTTAFEHASPPPPHFPRHWGTALRSFLTRLGLTQTLRGFESDMLIINEEWERSKVPSAVDDLVLDLSGLSEPKITMDSPYVLMSPKHSLDERKLDYISFANGVEPSTPTSINRSISRFLAQNRARNDASNRVEFLVSPAEKRKRQDDINSEVTIESSCARTDAKSVDRDVQMKYDIAKNEEGPLRRTVKSQLETQSKDHRSTNKGKQKAVGLDENDDDEGCLTTRHPGLDGRLTDMETHLAVRYVPSPPRTLLARLKFLEDHIIRLEKDYPPWAALHFNQPNRGWPPPPRPTPIIVPPHLRAPPSTTTLPKTSSSDSHSRQQPGTTAVSPPIPPIVAIPGAGRVRNSSSSLHRAVMERLEVQKAMSDLAGRSA